MAIEIRAPDGSLVRFPDGTDDETITKVMRQNFGGPEEPGAIDTARDVAKSAGIGLAQGAIGLMTLPGNLEQLGRMGINAVGSLAGADGNVVDPESFLPNYGGVKAGIERKLGTNFYAPQTTAGEYARTLGEFAPLAVGGPGGIAARGARVAVPAAASETAGQLTKGTALEPWARMAGAVAGGAAAQRAITPMPTDPVRQAAVRTLENEGVTALTAGQRTGRPSLRWAESMSKDTAFGGGRAAQMETQQAEQFTRAALRRAGIDADRATPDVMDAAFQNLGQRFNELAARNDMLQSRGFVNRLQQVGNEYRAVTAESTRIPIVEATINALTSPQILQNGRIPGRLYQNVRSDLSRSMSQLRRSDPPAANALSRIVDELDRAMEMSVRVNNRQDLGAWRQARNQYRNLLAIEDAVSGAGEATAAGLISPSALRNAVKKQGKRAYVRGQGDFAHLARAAEMVMKALPQSGTAPRINAMNVLHGMGGVVGYGAGGPLAAIGGMAAPAIGSRILMSGPMQRYLANQALPAGNAAVQSPWPARGLLALPGAMDAGLLGGN